MSGYRGDDYQLDEQGPSPLDHANWDVPSQAKVPGAILAVSMVAAWLLYIPRGGMTGWGLSASALASGHWATILLHMFAHAGLWHIVMKMSVLVPIAGLLTARLGESPGSWIRFLTLFVLGGLSGAALYLLIHPTGSVPMVGASGAICALVGVLLRLPTEGYELNPLRSERMKLAAKEFVKSNVILILLLTVPAFLAGTGGGVAWEGHLGGLLFGLFLGPYLLPSEFRQPIRRPAV